MFQSQEKKSLLDQLARLEDTVNRLTAEITQKNGFIQLLEKQICDRDEKLMLMLDPQKYNQFKLHNRPRVGAVEMTEEEKRTHEARKNQVQKDVKELIEMGVLSPTAAIS